MSSPWKLQRMSTACERFHDCIYDLSDDEEPPVCPASYRSTASTAALESRSIVARQPMVCSSTPVAPPALVRSPAIVARPPTLAMAPQPAAVVARPPALVAQHRGNAPGIGHETLSRVKACVSFTRERVRVSCKAKRITRRSVVGTKKSSQVFGHV